MITCWIGVLGDAANAGMVVSARGAALAARYNAFDRDFDVMKYLR
jgi:hypothetical protein